MENDQEILYCFCITRILLLRCAALDGHSTSQSTVLPEFHRGSPSPSVANESVAMSSSVATMLADPTVQIAFACVLISLAVGESVCKLRARLCASPRRHRSEVEVHDCTRFCFLRASCPACRNVDAAYEEWRFVCVTLHTTLSLPTGRIQRRRDSRLPSLSRSHNTDPLRTIRSFCRGGCRTFVSFFIQT